MGITRSHYYDWVNYHRDRELRRENQSKIDYNQSMILLDYWNPVPFLGYRKISYLMIKDGYKWASEWRIRYLMQKLGIASVTIKNTSKPGKGKNHEKYPYLLRNKVIHFVNQVWSTDITYIALPHGFVYLCAIVDWHSRKILFLRLSNTMDVHFCIDCLEDAILRFGVPSIFNSDQGYPDTFINMQFKRFMLMKSLITIGIILCFVKFYHL